jgi:hypothetical protein
MGGERRVWAGTAELLAPFFGRYSMHPSETVLQSKWRSEDGDRLPAIWLEQEAQKATIVKKRKAKKSITSDESTIGESFIAGGLIRIGKEAHEIMRWYVASRYRDIGRRDPDKKRIEKD